ncbi:MAG: nuclease domain-containing protein [Clostridium sp.]|uniref:nuclease domain-containing protein n=1 Tax=Clostridium sp. TaxID=1506 RepID=UPI003D6D1A67
MKIHHILSDLGYRVEEYGILKYKDNGFYLTLSQDAEAKMIYSNKKNRIELWYNKSYTPPTTNQRPDTVLNIRNLNNKDDNRIYIFDAKYRINVDDSGVIGPVEDDINVMHRYRDAIVSKLSKEVNEVQFKYDTFGAYVMFPYGDEEKFKEHHFYKSIEEVNIGAFPMLPGSTKLITKQLKKIIEQSSVDARNDRIVLDEYDDDGKFKHLNVMVVNVKNKEHLKAYKENLFYHIPISKLREVRESVKYLAFYQSKESFKDEGGVRYFARIKECIKYKREDCTELKARAGTKNDVYIRINLEPIEEVDNIVPIQTGTRLVTYTTLYLLKNAENTHQLKVSSSLELRVYKILKKVAKEKGITIKKIDKEKDAKTNKRDKIKEYVIGDVIVEIVDEILNRVNGVVTDLRKLEDDVLYAMENQ